MNLPPIVFLGFDAHGSLQAWTVVRTIRQAKRAVAENWKCDLVTKIASFPRARKILNGAW